MTSRCGQRGSELTQSWRVGPFTMVGASLDAIRQEKIIYVVLLTKTEGQNVQHCSSHSNGSRSSLEGSTRRIRGIFWSTSGKHGT